MNQMKTEDLHPEIRQTISKAPRLPFANRALLPLARILYNIGAGSKLRDGVMVKTETNGGLKMRVIAPPSGKSEAAILWMCGGGHVAGKPEHLDGIASLAAKELGVTVFAPKYRLAPKHPFPADLDDAHNAWSWLVENAQARGFNRDKLTIAGHSAGGGIATALVQKIKDNGGQQPLAQLLFYPMLDDRVSADRSLDTVNHFIWNNKANYVAWGAYLKPHKPGADTLPNYAAPGRRSDLSGLPPTWIGQCGLDLFLGEYRDYAERLQSVGVTCETHFVEGVPHAFELFEPDAQISRQFEMSALNFLKQQLAI